MYKEIRIILDKNGFLFVLTLAAVHTLGIEVDIIYIRLRCLKGRCSSLLLIPLASSLFGIPNEVVMQDEGVGFIVGVLQDSCETALNS